MSELKNIPEFTMNTALKIACEAHKGFDRAGVEEIMHPLRVAMRNWNFNPDPIQFMIDIMHDVIEDSDVTIEDLTNMRCPKEVTDALVLVTHIIDDEFIANAMKNGMSKDEAKETEYLKYVEAMRVNPRACKTKLSDLYDNMHGRCNNLIAIETKKFVARHVKYQKAEQLLKSE